MGRDIMSVHIMHVKNGYFQLSYTSNTTLFYYLFKG